MWNEGTALVAEVSHDEAKGAGELFVSLLWLNMAVDFNSSIRSYLRANVED